MIWRLNTDFCTSAQSLTPKVSARGHFCSSPGSVGFPIDVESLAGVGRGEGAAEVVLVVGVAEAVAHHVPVVSG